MCAEKCMNSHASLFILRVVLGAIFIAHGWQKIGMMDGVIGFFGSLGISAIFAYIVAYGELLAGIAMVLGVFTRLAGYLISAIMIGAIIVIKYKVGFIGGYELDLILLASALTISMSGPGMYATGKKVCGCNSCEMCGDKKIV
jgi:putative oxidoreductase